MEGRWVVAEGLVYPVWHPWDHRRGRHTYPVVGVDYGHGESGITAANAITWHWDPLAPRDPGRYVCVDEYHHQGPLDPNIHAARLVAQFPRSHFIIDPAPPPLYNALLYRAPGRVHKAEKGQGSVLETINHVNALMQAGAFLIDEVANPRLMDELYSYVWSETVAPITGADRPLKRNDHHCDAMRYAVSHVLEMREYIPITSDHPGEYWDALLTS